MCKITLTREKNVKKWLKVLFYPFLPLLNCLFPIINKTVNMKKWYLVLIWVCLVSGGYCQKKWDGEGGNNNWATANNWLPNGVPVAGDDVLLDNSIVSGSYTVLLPSGTVTVSIRSLRILPVEGNTILLHLPPVNTASQGLEVTGSGESLELGNGGTLRNSSGASSGEVLVLTGLMRINNGGRYLHNTARGNAALIDKLSVAAGTEQGIFEFDVPGTAGYTISITGNIFGSLVFSATAAGGAKSYSGSGTSTLQINGNLVIRSGVSLTSTLSANIILRGELEISGNLNLNPSTAGSTGRSILFTGINNLIKGNGNLGLNNNFRNLEVSSGSICTLARSINLPQPGNNFQVNSGGVLHTGNYNISGNGRFTTDLNATLGLGSPKGISITGNTGNIQTAARTFNTGAKYLYEGGSDQETGSGLPASINGLAINKSGGNLQLTKTVRITGELDLQSGLINTSTAALLIFSGNSMLSPLNQYGETNAGWENSFINGPMQWETATPGSQSIPIGKGTVFAPVKLNKINNGLAAFRLEYFSKPYINLVPISRPPLDHISKIEYWTIEADPTSADPNASVGLSWRAASGVGNTNADRNDLRIAQFENRGSGLQWEETGDAPQISFNGSNGLINSNQVTNSFSVFTLASRSKLNILPIRAIKLSSQLQNESISLKWSMVGEDSVNHFTIEKSYDGRNFSIMGLALHQKDRPNLSYNYTDIHPEPGLNYYRVRAISGFDSSLVSAITFQYLSQQTSIRLFPNPANDQLTLYFPEASSAFECMVVNNVGLKVTENILLRGKHNTISVLNLPKGRYSLIIKHQNKRIIIPFIKG